MNKKIVSLLNECNVNKDEYVLLGVYDKLVDDNNMRALIESEIKLNGVITVFKYKLGLHGDNVFIKYHDSSNSYVILKVYLLTKTQFVDVLVKYCGCAKENVTTETTMSDMFSKCNTVQQYFNLSPFQSDSNVYYNIIQCIDIINSMPLIVLSSTMKEIITCKQTICLQMLFELYRKCLCNEYINEYMLMHYVYLIEGIKDVMSLALLKEVFIHDQDDDKDKNNIELVLRSYKANNNGNSSNKVEHLFELNCLPEFDDVAGEFIWDKQEEEYKQIVDEYIKSENVYESVLKFNAGGCVVMDGVYNKDKDISVMNKEDMLKDVEKVVMKMKEILG